MNDDKLTISDSTRLKSLELLKNYSNTDVSEIDRLKFLKVFLTAAQGFSYKIYDEDEINEINLYDFLAYTLISHINDKYLEQDEKYIEILYALFQNEVNIKISQEFLMKIFNELYEIQISDLLKKCIYDICYDKHVIRTNEFYQKNENLNLNKNDKLYYNTKVNELINKYNINYYNEYKMENIDLNKINLSTNSGVLLNNIIDNLNSDKNRFKK